jgi:hypothetical protein
MQRRKAPLSHHFPLFSARIDMLVEKVDAVLDHLADGPLCGSIMEKDEVCSWLPPSPMPPLRTKAEL